MSGIAQGFHQLLDGFFHFGIGPHHQGLRYPDEQDDLAVFHFIRFAPIERIQQLLQRGS